MATGGLEGGEGLEKYLSDLADRMQAGEVAAGFMENARYPDGTMVAAVAANNEYGNSKQPPRPFFRIAIAKEGATWGPKLGEELKFTNYDAEKALALLGEDICGAVQESINSLTSPALADSTIARKGFAKPLIDSTQMINSTAYQVNYGSIIPVPPNA